MPFDFSALPIVDAHAHPFMPSREKYMAGVTFCPVTVTRPFHKQILKIHWPIA